MEERCDENTVSVGQYVGHFQVPKNSHFQNKAKCVTFLLLRFLHTRRKNHFQINGFALSLALRQRLGATRKWTWMVCSLLRAVEKVLSSRLIMKSRRLWNSHQRHKFLRAESSRDIFKFKVSEMPFPGVFKRYFPPRTPCYFVTIQARLETVPSKCPRRFSTSYGSNVSEI